MSTLDVLNGLKPKPLVPWGLRWQAKQVEALVAYRCQTLEALAGNMTTDTLAAYAGAAHAKPSSRRPSPRLYSTKAMPDNPQGTSVTGQMRNLIANHLKDLNDMAMNAMKKQHPKGIDLLITETLRLYIESIWAAETDLAEVYPQAAAIGLLHTYTDIAKALTKARQGQPPERGNGLKRRYTAMRKALADHPLSTVYTAYQRAIKEFIEDNEDEISRLYNDQQERLLNLRIQQFWGEGALRFKDEIEALKIDTDSK